MPCCGYLLHIWGAYHIIEAIILHYRLGKLLQKNFGISQAVYLANALVHQQIPDAEFIAHYKLTGVIDNLSKRAKKLI
ncbi:MAG: hypothetical protein ACI89T_000366 [Cognaticolwellia sp.]